MKKGFVALVGTGPGDIGLLTLRGMEYIQRAEVVLYDRLVSEEILELVPFDAKKLMWAKKAVTIRFLKKKLIKCCLMKL